MADSELMAKLARRQVVIDSEEQTESALSNGLDGETGDGPPSDAVEHGAREISESASCELQSCLQHRQELNEGRALARKPSYSSVYGEFDEFMRKQIKAYEATFKT